jgi:hypothetical protein
MERSLFLPGVVSTIGRTGDRRPISCIEDSLPLAHLSNEANLYKKGDAMAGITTTSVLPAPVQQTFSYKLLSVPVPSMIHKIPAMKKEMPRNGGTTLRMRRYNPLNTAMVPLGNSGVTPPPQNLTAIDIDAKLSFYGTYVQINEQVTLQNQDPKQLVSIRNYGVSKFSLIDLEAEA